jgi:hypothetical protein
VKELRGVVSGDQVKGSCFTLSGALTEFVAKYLYSTEMIFDFSDKSVPAPLRFPALRNLSFSISDPTSFVYGKDAGMVDGNSLALLADVGGYLPPKIPGNGKGFFGGAAYDTTQIAKTRIQVYLSNSPYTLTLAANVSSSDEFKILNYT